MTEENEEKLPLDAKLLTDAVIELNISRRSVGIYPSDHPIVRESIGRAYTHLEKLFEIRSRITLGIAKDTLVIDEFTLERKNPVFREFALALHEKGISALTFSSGLKQDELICLHEHIAAREGPSGGRLVESLREKKVSHISVVPVDFSSFGFAEGIRRKGETSGKVWEDYIYGLLEGRLGTGDSVLIQSVPPEEMAEAANAMMTEESSDETYERVITTFMQRKERSRLSRESLEKLFTFIDRLSPALKQQFLARSCTQLAGDIGDIESLVRKMDPAMFEKTIKLFSENASFIPVTMKNLMDKLSAIRKTTAGSFDFMTAHGAVFDDIEVSAEIMSLFGTDHNRRYVSQTYEKELLQMLKSVREDQQGFTFSEECTDEGIDSAAFEIILELIDTPGIRKEDYLALITKLSETMPLFIETGRFEEILEAYNIMNAHVISGRFAHEALSSIEYFFNAPAFLDLLIRSFRLWGRRDRESTIRLARAFRRSLIDPLLDSLAGEKDPGIRSFYISLLTEIGSDVVPSAVKRLRDERWHVLRNMICIIRKCRGGDSAVQEVRRLIKHDHPLVAIEALWAMLEFGTADAVPYLKAFLKSDSEEIKQGAIKLAGRYHVKDVIDHLIAILEQKDLLGVKSLDKIEAVRSLAKIGDPKAVPALTLIAGARTLLNINDPVSLRQEIFRSLWRYPAGTVSDLIKTGLENPQEDIREITRQSAAKLDRRGKR